ncbi:MAG: class I SAM-dependent methyltransferase [Polyangiaceae bacterium]
MSSYGRLCTEFYDIDKPEAPPDALEYYLWQAEQARGPILEPMCGSGRFLLPLLARGFDIQGSDSSPHMLAACRANAERQGAHPRLRQETLSELAPGAGFGLIFVPSGSMCLLTDVDEVSRSLSAVRAALAPAGRFVVEVERKDPQRRTELAGNWGGRWLQRPDGAKLMISWLSQYSAATGVVSSVHRYELIREGKLLEQEFEDFELKLYELSEFRALLESAGFTQIKNPNSVFARAGRRARERERRRRAVRM